MNDFMIVADHNQLAQFASDPSFSDAAIPTAAHFTAWNDRNYSGWYLRSKDFGRFKITGYDQATSTLTIRKMKTGERITLWIKETILNLTKFGWRSLRKIVNISKGLVHF